MGNLFCRNTMKSFSFAALAAVASAQTRTEGPITIVPPVTFGAMTSNGALGETWIQDDTTGEGTIWLYAVWENGVQGMNFPGGSLIQNYAQWSSTTEPGKFDGFTVSCVYDKSNGTTNTVTVRNIAESDSLTTADGKQNGKWDTVGTAAKDLDWFEQETDPAHTAEFYGRTFEKKKYSTATAILGGLLFMF